MVYARITNGEKLTLEEILQSKSTDIQLTINRGMEEMTAKEIRFLIEIKNKI